MSEYKNLHQLNNANLEHVLSFGFYLDISAWHNLCINSSHDQSVSILAANISRGKKTCCPHSMGPGFKTTRWLQNRFQNGHPSEVDQMSTRNLVVKSKLSPDSGSATFETVQLYPTGNYMFKVNNRNTRTRCEICSKLTIKIPERRHRLYHIQMFTICLFAEFPKNLSIRNWEISVGTLNSSAEGPFSSLMYVVGICKFRWIIVGMKSIWQRSQFVKSFFP